MFRKMNRVNGKTEKQKKGKVLLYEEYVIKTS
jgi:hypothetical protein